MKVALFLAFLCVSLLVNIVAANESNQNEKILVCYFGSWANYRWGNGQFLVEDIDPAICTHILYGFAGLTEDGVLRILDEYLDLEDNWGLGAMRRFTNLKTLNPGLKTLLAVGGWNECEETIGNSCEKYSNMVATRENRQRFIDSVIPFVEHYNFDGFDLDWEYPAFRGGRPEDKENFAILCAEMREQFDRRGLLLTAAVAAGETTVEDAYDVASISRSLHYIFLMSYDLHGAWEKFTHHQSPLGPIPEDTDRNLTLNVKYAVDLWLRKGCPPEKLIVGIGAYGRGWRLSDPNQNGFYAPADGPIDAGPYTSEAGFWGFNEILEKQAGGGWTIVRNPEVVGVYAYQGLQWIGYDDVTSVITRVEWIKSMGLGGAMFWSLETEDFKGRWSSESFPLVKAARRALGDGTIPVPSTTTTDPNQSTTTTSTTTTLRTTTISDGVCRVTGVIGDPNDCRKYFYCAPDGSGGFIRHEYTCSEGTIFDPVTLACHWYDDVENAPVLCGW